MYHYFGSSFIFRNTHLRSQRKKNVRLCLYSVLATNMVLVFAKPLGGSKTKEMGDEIQRAASILEEASKLLLEGKKLIKE